MATYLEQNDSIPAFLSAVICWASLIIGFERENGMTVRRVVASNSFQTEGDRRCQQRQDLPLSEQPRSHSCTATSILAATHSQANPRMPRGPGGRRSLPASTSSH